MMKKYVPIAPKGSTLVANASKQSVIDANILVTDADLAPSFQTAVHKKKSKSSSSSKGTTKKVIIEEPEKINAIEDRSIVANVASSTPSSSSINPIYGDLEQATSKLKEELFKGVIRNFDIVKNVADNPSVGGGGTKGTGYPTILTPVSNISNQKGKVDASKAIGNAANEGVEPTVDTNVTNTLMAPNRIDTAIDQAITNIQSELEKQPFPLLMPLDSNMMIQQPWQPPFFEPSPQQVTLNTQELILNPSASMAGEVQQMVSCLMAPPPKINSSGRKRRASAPALNSSMIVDDELVLATNRRRASTNTSHNQRTTIYQDEEQLASIRAMDKSEYRRQVHLRCEHRRRDAINAAYETLRKVLPEHLLHSNDIGGDGSSMMLGDSIHRKAGRMSKMEIMEAASRAIDELELERNALLAMKQQEIDKLDGNETVIEDTGKATRRASH